MTTHDPMVSIVIPTYNRAQYVTLAIDSVLSQTYARREVIVVDDGSLDGTAHALSPYRDHIRYIRQDNQGPAAARNTGITAARGEWVAFLDSDDEWLPGKLTAQMADVAKRPDLCAHVTNVHLQQVSGQPGVRRFDPRHFTQGVDGLIVLERPLEPVLRRGIAVTSALLARKPDLIRAGLFDTGLSLAERHRSVPAIVSPGPVGPAPARRWFDITGAMPARASRSSSAPTSCIAPAVSSRPWRKSLVIRG